MKVYLHTLFAQQAKKYPQHIALKFGDEEMTYETLEEKSNQFANGLVHHGVKPGDKIALHIERSFPMIIAILGCLKSGATYVPISTKAPDKRFHFLMEDLGNPLLICGNIDNEKFKKYAHVQDFKQMLYADDSWAEVPLQDESVAVILYTSGSTGNPKGVLLSHEALVNRLVWDRHAYKHNCTDVVLQHASYDFDFSILEIFMALASGGKLILARPDFHYDSFYLIQLIQKEHITKMGMGPSLLKAYIHFPAFEECTSLKQVFLGGETLHYNLQTTFHKKSSAELINIYGPTEASISITNWLCKRDDRSHIVPIGYPIAGMNIYILDEEQNLVPDGEIGEICASGEGVALGYLNRPELTQSRFLTDPFIQGKTVRMYRTGDLGRKLPSGAYEFLGRMDTQVKIRGLRIELEEIEYNLNLHDDIKASVVMKIEFEGVDKLVAYVLPVSGKVIQVDAVKNALAKNLPEYMVPGIFMLMESFQLTPNGKIDRKALPYPDKLRILSNRVYAPAENKEQERLIHLWEKVLKMKPIGVHDVFRDIGGDSLALLEIHHLMKDELGITLPIASITNTITIKKLDNLIQSDTLKKETTGHVKLQRDGTKTPIVYVLPIYGTINSFDYMLDNLHHEHPLIVTVPFELSAYPATTNIKRFAEMYVQSILEKFTYDRFIIGGFSVSGLVALEMAAILKSKGKSIEQLFLVDTIHPKLLHPGNALKKFRLYVAEFLTGDAHSQKAITGITGDYIRRAFSGWFRLFASKPIQGNKEHAPKAHSKNEKELIYAKMLDDARGYCAAPFPGKTILISALDVENPTSLVQSNMSQRYWKKYIFSRLVVYKIPSTHISLMENPNGKLVANIINEHMAEKG